VTASVVLAGLIGSAARADPKVGDKSLSRLPAEYRAAVEAQLDRAGGNQTVAARLLGMHRNTLLVKLAQLGLRTPEPGGAQSASSS